MSISRILAALILSLIPCTLMTGCKDKVDDPLVGQWKYDSKTVQQTFEFKPNGELTMNIASLTKRIERCRNAGIQIADQPPGSWTRKGESVVIKMQGLNTDRLGKKLVKCSWKINEATLKIGDKELLGNEKGRAFKLLKLPPSKPKPKSAN